MMRTFDQTVVVLHYKPDSSLLVLTGDGALFHLEGQTIEPFNNVRTRGSPCVEYMSVPSGELLLKAE